MSSHTPWPIIWSRTLRSSNATARHNARLAARSLTERRLEREDVERFLGRHERDRRSSSA